MTPHSHPLHSPAFIHSDAAAVCGGEGGGKHSAQLLCPGKPQTDDQLAERGGGARNQRKVHGEDDRSRAAGGFGFSDSARRPTITIIPVPASRRASFQHDKHQQ